jgi:protein tyrosine phosphatase (PTP) superfamily phosphohydrolase (DUF442 family)
VIVHSEEPNTSGAYTVVENSRGWTVTDPGIGSAEIDGNDAVAAPMGAPRSDAARANWGFLDADAAGFSQAQPSVLRKLSVAETSREDAPLALLNEIRYSAKLTAAGQPSEEQLHAVADAGFQRVIFLAFNDHKDALKNEDRIVRTAGLAFLHIPVAWDAPTISDFDNFAAVMLTSEKTLVHCEVNFRASVFGFLYQVIYRGTPLEEARSLLTSIWIPNETWEAYIISVFADRGIEYSTI